MPGESASLVRQPVTPTERRALMRAMESENAAERTVGFLSLGALAMDAAVDVLKAYWVMCECEGWEGAPMEMRSDQALHELTHVLRLLPPPRARP